MTELGALGPIVERKRLEAAALHCGRAAMFAHAANLEHAPAIERVLAGGTVIAELKRRSPSGGSLRPDLDPGLLRPTRPRARRRSPCSPTARTSAAHSTTSSPSGPPSRSRCCARTSSWRPIQVAEARVAGADWVLLIAAVFDDDGLDEVVEASRRCGAGALVEVHSDVDLDRAVAAGARCIGINNRDLTHVDTDLHLRPAARARPGRVVTVAESGVRYAADVDRWSARAPTRCWWGRR